MSVSTLPNTNYQVGVHVERIAKDYTGGRRGTIVAILDNNRAQVLWTKGPERFGSYVMKLKTKVRFQDLQIITNL